MKTRVLTVYEKLFDGEAREVILPGCDGEVCVLDFHQSFLYRLRCGHVKIKPAGPGSAAGGNGNIFIRDGVAAMKDNALDILVER